MDKIEESFDLNIEEIAKIQEKKHKVIDWGNGDIYKGFLFNKKPNGQGTMHFSNGDEYEGM